MNAKEAKRIADTRNNTLPDQEVYLRGLFEEILGACREGRHEIVWNTRDLHKSSLRTGFYKLIVEELKELGYEVHHKYMFEETISWYDSE